MAQTHQPGCIPHRSNHLASSETDPYSELYHLVLLVALQEGILGLASGFIQLSAQCISVASVARILLVQASLAPGT